MDDEQEKPKRRYQYSSKQKAKIKLRRKISKRKQELKSLELRNDNSKKKSKGVIEKKVKAAAQSDIIFEPNEGPQYSFLAAPEKEVLYGGAAGGGKSFAMLMDLLRYASNGNHRALLLRRTLAELTELIDKSKQVYPRAFPGAKFKESTIGVRASSLFALFKLQSWFPAIRIVGLILDKFVNNSDTIRISSGDISVFA